MRHTPFRTERPALTVTKRMPFSSLPLHGSPARILSHHRAKDGEKINSPFPIRLSFATIRDKMCARRRSGEQTTDFKRQVYVNSPGVSLLSAVLRCRYNAVT